VEAASCPLHNEDEVKNEGCFREDNKEIGSYIL